VTNPLHAEIGKELFDFFGFLGHDDFNHRYMSLDAETGLWVLSRWSSVTSMYLRDYTLRQGYFCEGICGANRELDR